MQNVFDCPLSLPSKCPVCPILCLRMSSLSLRSNRSITITQNVFNTTYDYLYQFPAKHAIVHYTVNATALKQVKKTS